MRSTQTTVLALRSGAAYAVVLYLCIDVYGSVWTEEFANSILPAKIDSLIEPIA